MMFESDFGCEFLKSFTGLKYWWLERNASLESEVIQKHSVIEFLSKRLKEIHFLGFDKFGSELCQAMRELKEQDGQIKIYFNDFEIDCLYDLLNG